MSVLLSALKVAAYPWVGLLPGSSNGEAARPYFGPPTRGLGGPGLKRKKLIAHFGNHSWRPNVLYLISGLSVRQEFVRWAKARGSRVLLNQDGVYTPSWYGVGFKAPNRQLSGLHALSDYVIYQSHFCLETAQRYLDIPPGQRSEILYNGVDLNSFTPPSERSAARKLRLLCAGNFYASKRYILKALLSGFAMARKRRPDMELMVAGKIEGGEAWLRTEAGERDLPAEALLYRPPYVISEGPALFREATVFVHLKNNDPCPSIVLEAMAAGLPVVHCRNGGTPELVGDGGIAIEHPANPEEPDRAPSPEQISAALLQAANECTSLGIKARENAARFGIDQWFRRHNELMTQLLQPQR